MQIIRLKTCVYLQLCVYLYCNHNTNIVKTQKQNVIHEYNKKCRYDTL